MSGTKSPPDQAERDRIVRELDRTIIVEAAAGTGKTTSLLSRMVELLASGRCEIGGLAAVTFTRKAAAELRARFQVALEKEASKSSGARRELFRKAASELERCFLGTIHSFCGRLLRERPVEAGVDVAFEEMEEIEDLELREEAWDTYVASLHAGGSPLLKELRRLDISPGDLKNSFSRFATYPDVDEWPAQPMPLPELRPVIEALGNYAAHMRELARSFPVDRGNDKLMDRYELICRKLDNADLDEPAEVMEVLGEFKKVVPVQQNWPGGKPCGKAELDRWEEFRERYSTPLTRAWREHRYEPVLRVLHGARAVYDRLRADTHRLNYQDLLLRAAGLLRVGPRIRQYFRRRFTHVLVDEFQDTDPIQAEVLLLLTSADAGESDWRKCKPVPGSLFVVGDPKQSIYRFRRADIVTYNQVRSIIEESGGGVVALTANFRSIEPVIDWVNRAFESSFPEQPDQFSPSRRPMKPGLHGWTEGERGVLRLTISTECAKNGGACEYEAARIARTIRAAVDRGMPVPRTPREIEDGVSRAVSYGDFLILTYRKERLGHYARKLDELGIPYQVSGSAAMRDVPELKLLRDCLLAALEPENPVRLLSVLRGGLFGISDRALYAYKKAKGRFSFHARVPEEGLESADADRVRDAFARLQRYQRWLERLPAVPALERIIQDLGLLARISIGRGGGEAAGCIGKALEVLRAAEKDAPGPRGVVEHLSRLVEESDVEDGLPARPHTVPVVRIMNVHQAKGLEAPIVFLADPTGKGAHDADFHIDRAGASIRGYMTIWVKDGDRGSKVLAEPENWEALAANEDAFLAAEWQRLLYVAATRAGAELVVSQRDKKENHWNPWRLLDAHLGAGGEIADPGTVSRAADAPVAMEPAEPGIAATAIEARWDAVLEPTYGRIAAKAASVRAGAASLAGSVEDGTEWGSVIHRLLETAMRSPASDLAAVAASALVDEGLEVSRADDAVKMARAVMASELWRRACASQRRLIEAPVQVLLPADPAEGRAVPTLLRGVIDLAFAEDGGWVIVDYKTDEAAASRLDDLVERYQGQVQAYAEAFETATGERVREAGLYFTKPGRYCRAGPV